MKTTVRSPLFYVGDKFRLMPQLKHLFPQLINNFYDVFAGGGSVSLNTKANTYYINDIDPKVIELHMVIQSSSGRVNEFLSDMYDLINYYGLSHSEFGLNAEIDQLKLHYKKTYFAKYNKDGYLKMRADYNKDQGNSKLLYLLLIYGFNHMIRFNKMGEFNLPVGNVDWNKNVTKAIKDYAGWAEQSDIIVSNMDFESFCDSMNPTNKDYFYFDPPYLITYSDYNKLWDVKEEQRLYSYLDNLNDRGVYWGLSNMARHKGKVNEYLIEWCKKYTTYNIESNYISKFDNTIKTDSKELFVTNVTDKVRLK